MSHDEILGPKDPAGDALLPATTPASDALLPATRSPEPEMFAGVGQGSDLLEWGFDSGLNALTKAGTLLSAISDPFASIPGLETLRLINNARKVSGALSDFSTGNLSGQTIVDGTVAGGKLGLSFLTGKFAPVFGEAANLADLATRGAQARLATNLDGPAKAWNRTHERVFGAPGPHGLFGSEPMLLDPTPPTGNATAREGELGLDVRGPAEFDVGPVGPELAFPTNGVDEFLPMPDLPVSGETPLLTGPVSGETPLLSGPVSGETPLLTGPVSGETPLLTGPVSGETPLLMGPVSGETPLLTGPVSGETPLLSGPVSGETPLLTDSQHQSAPTAGVDGPNLGGAGLAGGVVGGTLALGSDLFRKFVLGEEIENSQIAKDTTRGALEGGVGGVGEELVSHGVGKAVTPMLGAGASKIVGSLAGGGIVDGAIAGITSTLSNGDAVERGDVSASQATANVMVDAGVGVAAGLTGAAAGMATGAAVGTLIPVPIAGTALGGAIGAGAGFVGGAAGSIGLTMLAEHSGFSDWAKQGIGENIGFLDDPLSVMWSGINGTIDGAKNGALIGAAGGAAMGAIGTGVTGASLGLIAGGPLGAVAGGLGGAAVGAGGGALIGAGLGVVPGAAMGMGMGIVDGLADWLRPSAEQSGDFTTAT